MNSYSLRRPILVAAALIALGGCKPVANPRAVSKEASVAAAVDAESAQGARADQSVEAKAGGAGGETQPESLKASETAAAPMPAPAPPPWQKVVEDTSELRPYTEDVFQSIEESFEIPRQEVLAQWFEKAPEAGFRLGELTTQYGKCGTIEGVGRLKCPWPADGVLRLALENCNRIKLHFFHGTAGVTLIYYEDQNYKWAAYSTTREAGKSTPKTWSIAATDDDRGRRTEVRFGGPIELRYRGGELILSRGDVALLTAPLAGAPTDVFFEGRATFNGIELARAAGSPALLPAGPVASDIERPAELSWHATREQIAKAEPTTEGGIRLAADMAKERAECFTPIPRTDLFEVILQLEDVTPGAGVYLGRGEGKAAEVIRFLEDKKSGRLVARLNKLDDNAAINADPPTEKPVAFVQPNCWVKLLYGCGNLRWWVSTDGVHWAQVEPARDGAAPEITSIGLQVVAKRADTHLTLRRIQLRRLEGLSSLADEALAERAPAQVSASSVAEWTRDIQSQKPEQVDATDWLRAATIRTLAGGARSELAYPLLEALLDDAAERRLPIERQLAALDDVMLMCSELRDNQAMRRGIPTRYVRLAMQAGDKEGLVGWTRVMQHYQAAPSLTWRETPGDLDRAIRSELVKAAYGGPASQTLEFIRRLKFFQQHRERPLVDWVESLAQRETMGRPNGEAAVRSRESWREPLIEELSKDTYNEMTELAAALQSEAWEDAARQVASLVPEAAPGVAPYVNDRALLVSLPVAVQLVHGEYPALRETLGDQFAALAKLRINQAIAMGDVATMELATVQFAGTEAAADAHRWLGDRSLASGWFARARREYERAQEAAPALAAELMPRIRLAAAMLGRDAGAPVTEVVKFGEVSLSAAEYEALVAEMKGRKQPAALSASGHFSRAPVPAARQFEVETRSRFDGPLGDRPQEDISRRTNQFRLPWVDRQLATAADGDTLYVANRFQVAAYDLTSGLRRWQSQAPPGQMQRAQDSALVPMRPLIASDRIFSRMLYSTNPLLVCLEKATGKLLWTAESRDREQFVTDPVLIQGQLVVLQMVTQGEQGQLRWCAFDPQTGELLRQRDLVRVRGSWFARACCQVTALDDGLVAALGGATLSASESSNVRWMRTHVTLPAEEDPRWVLQEYQPPLVRGDKLFVTQPGVRTVDCLAVATGKRQWSAVLPEVVGIVGISGKLLVVRTEQGLEALDVADGSSRWRYDADDLYGFPIVDDHRLLVARRERAGGDKDQWQVRLTWIDPATGAAGGTTVLDTLTDADPRLGPLVPYQDRLFGFYGKGQHEASREFVELMPKGDAPSVTPAGSAWDRQVARLASP